MCEINYWNNYQDRKLILPLLMSSDKDWLAFLKLSFSRTQIILYSNTSHWAQNRVDKVKLMVYDIQEVRLDNRMVPDGIKLSESVNEITATMGGGMI